MFKFDPPATTVTEFMSRRLIAWVDGESTGLNVVENELIEIGVVITDDSLNRAPEGMVSTYHSLIKPQASFENWDPFCKSMHTENGLVADLEDESEDGICMYANAVDEELVTFIGGFVGAGAKILVAGSSVHFDHKFIEVRLPKFAKRLNHRLVDISGFQTTRNVILKDDLKTGFETVGAHRVMSDIENTLGRARALWSRVMEEQNVIAAIPEDTAAKTRNLLAAMLLAYLSSERPGFVEEAYAHLEGHEGHLSDGRRWSCEKGRNIKLG